MTSSSEIIPAPPVFQASLFTPTPKAAKRVLEFFRAQIDNDHTRKAYRNAVRRFAEWCEGRGIGERVAVQPFHVAAFIKELQGGFAPPTVEQHMAALRMLVRLAGDGAYPRREPGPCGPRPEISALGWAGVAGPLSLSRMGARDEKGSRMAVLG
jgi:hypothetical protein